jgi:hypothetical protein
MAVSGSRDFIYTRDQIITAALRKLSVVKQGGTPSANQLTYGSEALNIMQFALQNRGILLWTETDGASKLTADVNYVTISSAADIVEVKDVCFRHAGSDTPLAKMTEEEYKRLSNKEESGSPTHYFIEYLLGSTKMWLYPVYEYSTGAVTGTDAAVYVTKIDHTSSTDDTPTTGTDYATNWELTTLMTSSGAWADATAYYSGHVKYTKVMRLQDVDSGTDNPDFHVRAYEALVYGLMDRLSPEYNKPLNERRIIKAEAEQKMDEFMAAQGETGNIRISPNLSGRPRGA